MCTTRAVWSQLGALLMVHTSLIVREISLSQVLEQTSIAESQREQETFPACAYAALEFCERHLGALRNQLKQVRAQNMSGISNISDGIAQMQHGFHAEGNDDRGRLQQPSSPALA